MAEETEPKGKSGKGFDWQKHKGLVIGGGLAVAVILFLAVRSANKNSSAAATPSTTAQSGIDPATGYPSGSLADQDALAQANGAQSAGTTSPVNITITNPTTSAVPVGHNAAGGIQLWPASSSPPVAHATPVAASATTVGVHSGAVTRVGPGQTVESIAADHGIPAETVRAMNASVLGRSGTAQQGQQLRVA
jgi:hypothetical protein